MCAHLFVFLGTFICYIQNEASLQATSEPHHKGNARDTASILGMGTMGMLPLLQAVPFSLPALRLSVCSRGGDSDRLGVLDASLNVRGSNPKRYEHVHHVRLDASGIKGTGLGITLGVMRQR